MSGAHAFLPPSGASSWVECAAWPTMNARYPQDDTEDTREGEAAHWAFFEMLYSRPVAEGLVAPNGVTLTEEMLDAAELYVDVIDTDLATCGLDRRYLLVEQRVRMPTVHEQNWGTPDTYFYDQRGGRIKVYDFKYGHKFVDAFENWQCIDYACGILDGMGVTGLQDQHIGIDITVVQPRNYDRAGPVRRWSIQASDLRAHINRLRNAAEAALMPNPEAKVGEHCEYCPGRHACNTLQRAAYAAVHHSQQSTPVELPAAALGTELAMLQRALTNLKARVSGLEQEAEARIKFKGERIPGYALEETYGRETWTAPPEQVIAIGKLLNVDVSKVGVITPKQAIKAGLHADLVKRYSGSKGRGVALVVDRGEAARKVFGK